MFCPRCGLPNPDTTKFCRQCGLGLQQVTGYVASGGTAQFPQQQPASADLISKATDGITPKQQMILMIMLMAMSPAIFGVLGLGSLSGISAVLMPIGIVFAVMRYKAQKRRLQEMMMQQMYPPMPQVMPQQQMPPVAPYSLPQAGQQPIQQSYQPPVYQPSPPPTNPLKPPASVVEDETKRFQ
ncbi:MAG: zinc ribbon domain-containing protein [Acidobacteriota bacterium]